MIRIMDRLMCSILFCGLVSGIFIGAIEALQGRLGYGSLIFYIAFLIGFLFSRRGSYWQTAELIIGSFATFALGCLVVVCLFDAFGMMGIFIALVIVFPFVTYQLAYLITRFING